MNAKIIVLLLLFLVFISGCAAQQPVCTADAFVCTDGTTVGRTGPDCEFECPASSSQPSTGTLPPVTTLPPVSAASVKEFNMTAKRFEFIPNTITVNRGDEVVLRITSTDVEHGFSLATYDIIETLPPGETRTIRFTADQAGEFNFFCSVFCGSGHQSMRGKLVVSP